MRRVPHIVNLAVGGVLAEAVLLGLDRAGVAAHSGSACSSESIEPSPVLAAMGVDPDRSLRLSVGWSSTDADVEAFADGLPTGGGAPARPYTSGNLITPKWIYPVPDGDCSSGRDIGRRQRLFGRGEGLGGNWDDRLEKAFRCPGRNCVAELGGC